jgi:hypothetical protein
VRAFKACSSLLGHFDRRVEVRFSMDRDFHSVIEAGLELSPEDRVKVADALLESVPEQDIMQAWLTEASRRAKDWDEGRVEGIDSNEAIRQARELLKR